MRTDKEFILSYLKEEINSYNDMYKEEVKMLIRQEKDEINMHNDMYKDLAKRFDSIQIQTKYKENRDKAVSKVKTKVASAKEKAEMRFKKNVRKALVQAIESALKEDIDPSFLYSIITKFGFKTEVLLGEAIELREKAMQEELREELRNVFKEMILGIFDNNPNCSFEAVLSLLKDENICETQIEDKELLIKDAYDNVRAELESQYKKILEEASEIMIKDEVEGCEFIKNQPHLNCVLSCSNKTLEDLINEVKQNVLRVKRTAHDEKVSMVANRLSEVEKAFQSDKKNRNILCYLGAICLVSGFLYLSIPLILVALVLGGIAYKNHKKLENMQQKLSRLKIELQKVKDEFD